MYIYYSGVEYGRECFCGDTFNSTSLDDTRCSEYACSGNSEEYCGGFNAVDIYRTGLKGELLFTKCTASSSNIMSF